jgi:SOS-response transcriptional repressor LexA
MIESGREPSESLVTLFNLIAEKHENETARRAGAPPSAFSAEGSENRLTEEPTLYGARFFLKAAREKAGLSLADLAKRVGYSVATYREIEDGRAQMGEKMARKIAAVLDVEAADLMNGGDHPPENGALRGTFGAEPSVAMGPGMEGHKAKFVPLLSMAQAGTNAAWTTEGYAREGFLSFDPKDRDAFAVTLAGDSMSPIYTPGDVALVYPNHAPRNGDLVIAVLDDDHGADVMFKIYSPSGQRVTLSSYNPAYPPMEFPRSAFRSLFPVVAVTKVLRR